jgi:transposase-like protein
VSEVAQRLGVRPGTLSWWRWQLRREHGAEKLARRQEFVPVVVAEPVSSVGGTVELAVGAVRLRVEAGVDVQYVAALVNALSSSC